MHFEESAELFFSTEVAEMTLGYVFENCIQHQLLSLLPSDYSWELWKCKQVS